MTPEKKKADRAIEIPLQGRGARRYDGAAGAETEFIVGELSVNWCSAQPEGQLLLSQRFELLIAVNWERGYELVSFTTSSVLMQEYDGPRLNETLIAVFRKRGAR